MKLTRLMSLVLVSFATMVTACDGSKSKAAVEAKIEGDILHYDRENYISTHKGMRTLGEGYATENYTTVKTKKGRYDCMTDVKALVVGVEFTDYLAADLPKGAEGTLKDLQHAIFGKSEETGWESLKSYYNKTSYGICNITGTVVPEWYNVGVGIEAFAAGEATNKATSTNATKALAQMVVDWAAEKHGINPADYDANGDGFIDSVIMIYTCEPHVRVKDDNGKDVEVDDDLYWAFCWSTNAEAKDASVETPVSYRFFWSSYYTFYEDGYYDEAGAHHDWSTNQIKDGTATLDAHTLIHEFGHVLSLPDYYNGDYGSSDKSAYDPLGALDMMAYNVGDHNAFSKALYGWISPYLVYGDATITMKSTTDYGHFVVIPVTMPEEPSNEFTLLSQYVMIEFLTPTGVAKADSEDAYAGSYPIWFSEAGVRVTLVDARLGVFSYSSSSGAYSFQGITGAVSAPSNTSVTKFAADNCHIADSFNKDAKIIEILPATGKSAKMMEGNANNACLFKQGDEFNTGNTNAVFNKFCAHDRAGNWKQAFNFGFTITEMTDTEVTITIAKH